MFTVKFLNSKANIFHKQKPGTRDSFGIKPVSSPNCQSLWGIFWVPENVTEL